MANGITIGTSYRVYAVQKVQTVSGELVQLVHLGRDVRLLQACILIGLEVQLSSSCPIKMLYPTNNSDWLGEAIK